MKMRIALLMLSTSLAGAGTAAAQTTKAVFQCEPTPAVRQGLSSRPYRGSARRRCRTCRF